MKKFKGGGDHFGNFVNAVRARDPKLLHADILECHLSCAHSHLANISYYLGKPASVDEIRHALADWKTNEDVDRIRSSGRSSTWRPTTSTWPRRR